MLLANVLLLISSLTGLLLGLFIFVSNPKKPVNRALSALLFGIFIWLGTNLLTNVSEDPSTALFFARTTLIGASILPYTFLLFCKIYTNEPNFTLRKKIQLAALPLLLIFTFPTKLNIVSIDSFGQNTVTGNIYFLLTPVLLGYFGWGLWILLKRYNKTKSTTEKAQLRLIFVGISLTLIPSIIANAILPAIGNNAAILYAPNTVIIMAIFMSIAIIKHRLLDVRIIVARSVAYILLVSTIATMYGVALAVMSSLLFDEFSVGNGQILFFVILGLFMSLTLQPIRKFIDKGTQRLFYRDAYDPQEFIGQLNKVLASKIDLDPLLTQSAQIIEANLKPEYCFFGILPTKNTEGRMIGSVEGRRFSDKDADIQLGRELIVSVHEKVIVTDDLDEKRTELQRILRKNNIAVLVRLTTNIKKNDEGLGYLVLGAKKSGNLYSSQDIRLMEIIANELVIAIQNALRFEEIEQFNITLQGKVDDATRQLRRTNEKLKQLDETKDEFISMASHQLRTPLTSVKGYVSMVMEGDAGKLNSQQKKLLDQAFLSSQRMVYLIADLLNVSRLKTGKFIIESKPTNLAELVEGELEQLKETAKSRNLELTFHKPKEFPTLMLDETKIRQVVMNFADNAIYYTPSGGHIQVNVVDKPETIELTVVDDGLGVPKHEQPHLFGKFYRAGNAKKARPDGTGLGLFMAKKVIIAQGGSIIFKSEEGKGSTFGFTFAKSALAVPAHLKPTKKDNKVSSLV